MSIIQNALLAAQKDNSGQALEARLTRKYNPGWDYLDEWRYVGQFWEIHRARIDECFDSKIECALVAVMPESGRADLICQAIADTLSGGSCQHEHDCCGCWHYSASVRPNPIYMDGNGAAVYAVKIYGQRNV